MQVKTVSIDSISQDPANLRRHGERNLASIVASLRKFGQQHPIVVTDQGVILSGNGRYQAAKQLGWKEITVTVTSLKGSDATAYAIADNRTAELAEWDDTALAETLRALQSEDYEIEAAGYTESEIDGLIKGLADDMLGKTEVVEDEVPEPPADPITKPGDLWILGEHRLLCGDSTKAEDVARLMDGQKPFIMVTDPPYGVEYDPNWREGKVKGFLDGTKLASTGLVTSDDVFDWTLTYQLFPGHVAYVWHAGVFAADLALHLRNAQFKIRSQIVWRKPNFVISRGHYHWQHEPCWYAVRSGQSSKWCGDRTQSTTWDIRSLQPMGRSQDKNDSPTGHGTQKPVECMARPIRNHGDKNDIVYDPFLGSGTTLIAAEQLGRKCYGMEISRQYCDVIVKRWEQLTGMVAVRETPVGTPD